MSSQPAVTVVGIGADGWGGLSDTARAALARADVVVGATRQLGLLPPEVTSERIAWPSPLRPAVGHILEQHRGRHLAVLASGDPLWHGIGRALVEVAGAERLRFVPHPSSLSLACAALGWPVEDTETVSLLTQPVQAVGRHLHPGARIVVLSRDARTPEVLAGYLREQGLGGSRMTLLGSLGGTDESRVTATADEWDEQVSDPLNVVAVEVRGSAGHVGEAPGLPDHAFDHDGQITKREVRALTLSSLAPAPGELLWDVGGGSGSIAIEWMRAHRRCRAISIERDALRAERIHTNAHRLGVTRLRVVHGSVPAALEGLDRPDAVFIGGGLTAAGVVESCWAALGRGGRLVANAVTLQSEAALLGWQQRLGGELVRIEISRADRIGRFTAWQPARPVVQWVVCKPTRQTEEQ